MEGQRITGVTITTDYLREMLETAAMQGWAAAEDDARQDDLPRSAAHRKLRASGHAHRIALKIIGKQGLAR